MSFVEANILMDDLLKIFSAVTIGVNILIFYTKLNKSGTKVKNKNNKLKDENYNKWKQPR